MSNNKQGVLPSQFIRHLIKNGYIYVPEEYQNSLISEEQIQPASVDLTLGNHAYCIRGRPSTTQLERYPPEKEFHKYNFPLNTIGTPLDETLMYLIPSQEQCKQLPKGIIGYANNKSSSGRINLQTKLTTKYGDDIIPEQQQSQMYLRIMPKLFPVLIRPGDTLNQIRFIYGNADVSDIEIETRQKEICFLYDKSGNPISLTPTHLNNGLIAHLDLEQEIVGWKGKPNPSETIDLSRRDYPAQEFWEKLHVDKHGRLFLEAGKFYILSTKEYICVPPEFALEMLPYDLNAGGEFRSHYAGFFDPGFGWNKDHTILGRPATLEVIPLENMYVEDGHGICKFKVERMAEIPDKIYGEKPNSNYQQQLGPQLAKYFR